MIHRTPSNAERFSVKCRLIIFHNSNVNASTALAMPEEEINYEFFLSNGVKAVNFIAADVSPLQLKQRGFDSASKMRNFGFDALHLVNASFCNKMLLAYGRDDVIKCFLNSPQDAVGLAGSPAVTLLKVSTTELLQCCIGFPSHAFAVVRQLPPGCSLKGVSASLLLDVGLRLATLALVGYTIEAIIEATGATPMELQKLGFAKTF